MFEYEVQCVMKTAAHPDGEAVKVTTRAHTAADACVQVQLEISRQSPGSVIIGVQPAQKNLSLPPESPLKVAVAFGNYQFSAEGGTNTVRDELRSFYATVVRLIDRQWEEYTHLKTHDDEPEPGTALQ